MIKSRQAAGIAVATLVGIFYGLSIVFARMSYDHGANVLSIVVLRYTLLCAFLWVWLRVTGVGIAVPKGVGVKTMLIGIIAVSTTIAYLASVAYIPVSLGTLVFYTHPLITVLLAALFMGARSTWVEVTATVIAIVELAIVLQVSFDSLNPIGLALGMFASLTAAIVFVMASRVMKVIDPLRFTFYLALGAAVVTGAPALVLALGAPVFPALVPDPAQVPTHPVGLALLAGTVLLNVGGLLGMFVSVRLIGPVATPMMLNIEPVTAIAFAVLLIGEHMTVLQTIAGALVILAVLVSQWSRSMR